MIYEANTLNQLIAALTDLRDDYGNCKVRTTDDPYAYCDWSKIENWSKVEVEFSDGFVKLVAAS